MQADSATTTLTSPPPPAVSPGGHDDQLSDFNTKTHLVLLSCLLVQIGAISALVAYGLLWLIAVITNLAFYQRFSALPSLPQGNHLGWWVVAVPVIGALIIGLMARFGSEKIRGHGIPEAIEAILYGERRFAVQGAIL